MKLINNQIIIYTIIISVLFTASIFTLHAQESQLDPDKLTIIDGTFTTEYGIDSWSIGHPYGAVIGDYNRIFIFDDQVNSGEYSLEGIHITAFGSTSAYIRPNGSCLGCLSSAAVPDNSAILELQSTDKGFLPPRIANTNSISNPAIGLMVYNTTNNSFEYYDGTSWQNMGNGIRNSDVGNTFAGSVAGNNNTGNYNTGFANALRDNTTGLGNSGFGWDTLLKNVTGNNNVAIGRLALRENITASNNVAVGVSALKNNTSGNANVSMGFNSLFNNLDGNYNVAVGTRALEDNISGDNNTAIGRNAFSTGSSFNNSTAVGQGTVITASNQVRFGNTSITSIGGFTNWSNISDARVKKNIRQDISGLDFVRLLNPVSYQIDTDAVDKFHHQSTELDPSKTEKSAIRYTGFIAQEVQAAADKIGFDFSGVDRPKNEEDLYSIRYAAFVVPLVKSIQEQQAIIENLKEENNTLAAEIKELKAMVTQILERIDEE